MEKLKKNVHCDWDFFNCEININDQTVLIINEIQFFE